MLTIESKTNKQIAHNLAMEGMEVFKKQQKMIIAAINSKKHITNELIRKIALKC